VTDAQSYDGPERRWTAELPVRRPRWALRVGFVALFLAVMLPIGYILRLSIRSDARAERAGRTVCELATGFNRALDLLDPDTRQLAERSMREPLNRAAELNPQCVLRAVP
jgi:hypothetical protein